MNVDSGLIELLYVAGGAAFAFLASFVFELLKRRPDYDEIEKMTTRMVEAAQQMWELTNEEKYVYVTQALSKWLKAKGWDISPELIQVFIESSVRLLRREEKLIGVNLEHSKHDESVE